MSERHAAIATRDGRTPRPVRRDEEPPLEPELIRIIEALAWADARRDHAREAAGHRDNG